MVDMTKPAEAAKAESKPVRMGYYEVTRGIWPKHWDGPEGVRRKWPVGAICKLPEDEGKYFKHCLAPSTEEDYAQFRKMLGFDL